MLQSSYSPTLDKEKDTININAFASLKILGLIGGDHKDFSDFSLKEIRKASTDLIDKKLISYVLEKTGWNRFERLRSWISAIKPCLKKSKSSI